MEGAKLLLIFIIALLVGESISIRPPDVQVALLQIRELEAGGEKPFLLAVDTSLLTGTTHFK
jgi:hypothetical protein